MCWHSTICEAAAEMRLLGWDRAARVASRHVSSRINAATLLPTAVLRGRRKGVRTLGRHVLGVRPPARPGV